MALARDRMQSAGTSSAGPVRSITLGQAPGAELRLLDLGATMQSVLVTGADDVRRDVVLGHREPQDYLDSGLYLGGTIGRYANRIAEGRFTLDGVRHQVGTNDRGNQLHGGPDGFDRRIWAVEEVTETRALLSLDSPDGDQGYPGRLRATAEFEVTGDEVRLTLTATTDAPTVVNLTSHGYWNLDGSPSVDEHFLRIPAERYTPVDRTGIPTGSLEPVAGTPFDLRTPTRLGVAARTPHPQVVAAQGIDHNLMVSGDGLRPVAVLDSPRSRQRLVLSSDQPGLQVYTGNFLDGSRTGTDGRLLRQGAGIALEPQLFPDTPNRPDFGSAVLRPGETYRSRMVWSFERL